MGFRNINEYLTSGEVNGINMKGTINFSGLSPEDDGLFVRVNSEGSLYGYRAVNRDLEWVATDNSDVSLDDTEKLLVELTVDHDITAANGSFLFTCKIDNGSSTRDDFVNIIIRDGDNNAISSKSIQIDKGDTGYSATFYGPFSNDYPSGTTFRVYATSNKNSIVKGTNTPTSLKIVESQAEPVTEVIKVDKNLGNGISRAEIDNAIVFNNVGRPIDKKVYVIVDNAGHAWSCRYLNKIDKFAVKKLNLK